MIKQTFVVLSLLGMLGCERAIPMTNYDCPETLRAEQAEFILSCIKNGNPLSDEAPEDWIPLCEEIGKRLFCKEVKGFRAWGSQPSGFVPCDQAKTPVEQQACRS